MTDFELQVIADYESFREAWGPLGYDETATQQYWALLGELDSGDLLLHLPEWLAEEKVGYHDGATPRAFVGRIAQETDQAIKVADSAGARRLSQLATRIQSLEESIDRLESQPDTDPDRVEWLTDRLQDKRQAFETREECPTLAEEWLPKSQLEFIGRRAPSG